MISSTIDPRLAAQQADTKDLIRFKQEMDGLRSRLSDGVDSKEKQLRKACENFEAVFIGKLWKQMRSTVPKEGYLHSKQEDSYLSMFDREFSEKMAQSGGIGLADMIYSQLSEKLKESSKATLSGGVGIKPLVPQPVPLNKGGAGIPLDKDDGITLEEWNDRDVSTISGGNVSESDETPVEPGPRRMTDIEVQAKLDALARRLEAQRIKDGLLGKEAAMGSEEGYRVQEMELKNDTIGRKIAKIG